MLLSNVQSVLYEVTTKTYHYSAPTSAVFPYVVWMEDGSNGSMCGDGKMINQALQGTIHIFSKTETEALKASIPTALSNAGIAWRLNSIQHEPTTGIIHTEYVWEISTGV